MNKEIAQQHRLEKLQSRANELQVMLSELTSGNTTGAVYEQESIGSVFYLINENEKAEGQEGGGRGSDLAVLTKHGSGGGRTERLERIRNELSYVNDAIMKISLTGPTNRLH